MRRYLVTADRDPKKVGDSGGFLIESIAEYDPRADRTTNVTADFDLTEVYPDDLARLRRHIAEARGLAPDEIDIELI